MRHIRKKPLNKPRFAVDINTSFYDLRKEYGMFATFKSTARITRGQQTEDEEIVKICQDLDYHVITRNTKDFEELPIKNRNLKIGIICINADEKNYKSKFGSILRKFPKHENYYNKLFQIGNEIKIIGYTRLRSENNTGK